MATLATQLSGSEEIQVPEDEDDQLEKQKYRHEPEEAFGGFVVEGHHTPECSQRAEERRDDEGPFGDAPFVLFRPAFVDAKEQKGDDVAGEPDDENERYGKNVHRIGAIGFGKKEVL